MIQCFDEFEFDADKLELRRAGRPIKADALLLRILGVLVRRPGELITKQQIVSEIWGGRAISDNSLSVAVARLRKLLGHERSGREIVCNVHGRGYRFVRPVTPRDAVLAPLLSVPLLGRVQSPFVGRSRALELLREALEEAHAGRGGLCVVSGEAGIGKTRAVEMAAREAAGAGLPVAWGYCREVGDTPALWPIAQLLRALLSQRPPRADDARHTRLAPELERLFPGLIDAAVSGEPVAEAKNGCVLPNGSAANGMPAKHRSFDALAEALALAAEAGPCVLVLDDLHRADPATLEFLRYLVDEIARTRLLLVATVRPGEAPSAHLDVVLGHRNTLRIELQRLREPEVASYLAAVLGVAEADPALVHALFDKSEGNPFFMTELARQLRDDEPVDLDGLQVPHAALELVRQRVARLDDAARGALSHAAVIGRQFGLPVLQAITGRDRDTLMADLDRALAGGILRVEPESTTTFAFNHELLRGVLYDALTPAQRRECHLAVAQALEQRMAVGDALPAADLAYHFRAALPAGDPRQTVRYCIQASEDASRVFAYADGARYMQYARQALDLTPHGSSRLRLRLLVNQTLLARSSPEFEPLVRELIAAARMLRRGVELAYAGLLLDPYRGFPGERGSREVLEEALTLLPDTEPGTRAAALARLASIPPLAYDAERSRQQLMAARQLAEVSREPLALYNVRMAELYMLSGPKQRLAAESAMREIEALCETPGLSMTSQTALLEAHRAIAALQDGHLGRAQVALARGEQRAERLDPDLKWQFSRLRALAQIAAGDRAAGCVALRALHGWPAGSEAATVLEPSHSNFRAELFAMFDACVVLEEPKLIDESRLSVALASRTDDPPNIWALKVRTLAAAGATHAARLALADVTPESLARLPCDRDYLGTLGTLTRAALALNAGDYLEALLPLLASYERHVAANVVVFCEGSIAHLIGLVAARLGQPEHAVARFEQAVAQGERAGLLACAAEARLELALARANSSLSARSG